MASQRLAVITGASSGIGYELARCAIESGFDLLIAANEPAIHQAGQRLERHAAGLKDETRRSAPVIDTLEVDLATAAGVERLCGYVGARPVELLAANAGVGLGSAFLEEDLGDINRMIATNVLGTVHLVHRLGRRMATRGSGRILITGSIAGTFPGPYHAVYSATKAFLNSFAQAVRAELENSGVTVTCLMPGATETQFFRRAGLLDTKIGSSRKATAASVAQRGFTAALNGKADIVTGIGNKVRALIAKLTPAETMAKRYRPKARPRGLVPRDKARAT
ncbi:MAG: SDR family NAD(P)-dependent oxidoreductase [Hyphomicrobiales bacterium]